MGKRKIKIEKIEEKSRRRVTFTKRRQGLCKKAQELGEEFDAQVAVISISEAGRVFAFGHPDANSIVQRYKEAKKAESSSGKRDVHDDEEQVHEERYKEAKKAESSSGKRDDHDDEEQVHEVQYLLENDDESPDDHDDRQEVQYLLERDDESPDDHDDQTNKSDDQMDLALTLSLPMMNGGEKEDERDLALTLSLPMMNGGEKEDESSGMMIKNSETEKGLANLPAGGIGKNNSNQDEQDKGVLEEGENLISGSKMIMLPLLRDVPVEKLELDEVEQLMAVIEKMKKKVMDRANEIKKSSTDQDSSRPGGNGTDCTLPTPATAPEALT